MSSNSGNVFKGVAPATGGANVVGSTGRATGNANVVGNAGRATGGASEVGNAGRATGGASEVGNAGRATGGASAVAKGPGSGSISDASGNSSILYKNKRSLYYKMNYASELKRFPPVELPMEQMSNKDIRDQDVVYLAQPCGKRAFAWFTYFRGKNVCFFVEIKDRKPANIYPVHAAFASSLALGTVLHGTITHHESKRCFVMDNIFHHEGVPVTADYAAKLKLMLALPLDNCVQLPTQAMFMLPVYSYHPTPFDTIYKLYCVKCVQLHGPRVVNCPDKTAVFQVKATPTCDMYELHNPEGFHSMACVDTYARSVKMNGLFRRVKENEDLDAVEESDDESDPNTVFLHRVLPMLCRWHPLHKKWTPISVA